MLYGDKVRQKLPRSSRSVRYVLDVSYRSCVDSKFSHPLWQKRHHHRHCQQVDEYRKRKQVFFSGEVRPRCCLW